MWRILHKVSCARPESGRNQFCSNFMSHNLMMWTHLATRGWEAQSVARRKKEGNSWTQWLSFWSPGAHCTFTPTHSAHLPPSQRNQPGVPFGHCIQLQVQATECFRETSCTWAMQVQWTVHCRDKLPVPDSHQLFRGKTRAHHHHKNTVEGKRWGTQHVSSLSTNWKI